MTNGEIIPTVPSAGAMIFPVDHTPGRKVLLQDATTSADTQENLNNLIHAFEDIMSLPSNDIDYTKLIEVDTDADPNLQTIASKPYKLPLKC